eukprot:3995693-Amphidinium_carterae.1
MEAMLLGCGWLRLLWLLHWRDGAAVEDVLRAVLGWKMGSEQAWRCVLPVLEDVEQWIGGVWTSVLRQ